MAAALCYTPQQKLRGWSWQTYWLAQAFVCWLSLPIIGAYLTIPQLGEVLRETPKSALAATFLLGVAYGIGGTAFGLAIRYIGYSLTYAIAIGISCVLGTLTGPLLSGALYELLNKTGSGWVMTGIFIGVVGTLVCGWAGRMKERELQEGDPGAATFVLGKGLLLCFVAGVLSSIYGIAVNDAGAPIAQAAERFGAGHWQMNAVYIFSNSGAFLTTMLYTLWLGRRDKSFGEFRRVAEPAQGALPMNYAMALLTGCLWYSQFLFYGLGHVRMGRFAFSSWAIHMIMLILFSSLTGIVLREWHGRRMQTKALIALAFIILFAAVMMLTYGNYLGEQAQGG
ncbi:MAG: rhamnose:proton symporter [Candidatus Hydrogenedentes bacterium]|nr:rhamnose:proton symporter [Candidatus Hydrogenedentota bacterium]